MNIQPKAPLDQSNDKQLRLHSLNLAAGLAMSPTGDADFVVDYAREFYLFLVGRDPIVDVQILTSDNVISIEKFLEEQKGRVVAPVDRDDLDV